MKSPEELAHAWREALVGRDADALGALFAEDALLVDVEHRTADLAAVTPIVGREAITALTRRWLEESPPFDYDVIEVLADGSSAAVLWRYRVLGEEGPVEFDGVSWLRCASGEIVDARVYFDSLGLYRGLDLV